MSPLNHHRFLAIGLLVSLLTFIPTGLGQNADEWSTETVPTAGLVPNVIVADSDGERLGVLWRGTSTQDTGFSLREDDTWTLKTSDITGAGTNLGPYDVEHITGSTWGAVLVSGAGTDTVYYRSTDDGETWTLEETFTGYNEPQLEQISGNEIAIVNVLNSNGIVFFQRSTDAGTTWTSPCEISGNQGSCAVADTQHIFSSAGTPGFKATGNRLDVVFTETGSVYHVYSDDGGDFWRTPYTANGGATKDPIANTCTGTIDNTGNGAQGVISNGIDGGTAMGLWAENNSGQFVCTMRNPLDRDTGAAFPVPTSPPPTATKEANGDIGRVPADMNPDEQVLIAIDDTSTGELQVYYFSDSSDTSAALVHTITANSNSIGAVEMTPIYGYVLYVDNAGAGQLKADRALTFIVDDGELTRWCSNPAVEDFGGDPDADFGYNYVEQAEFEDPVETGNSLDLEDAYVFTSEEDDYAFMGKGWQGNQATKSVFRIEADSEGESTVFRSALSFSFGDRIPSSTTKGTGSTAGDTSGAFEEHIAARFEEVGNDWQIRLQFNKDSGDDGTPVNIGGTVSTGSPNTPTTYWFVVDTRGDGFAAIQNDQGEDIVNETMAGHSNPLFASFQGEPMYSQWFVVSGNNNLALPGETTWTALDDNLDSGQEDDSTCLFFLDAPVIIEGDLGTQPGSEAPDEPGGGDGDGAGGFSELFDPDNIDSQLFIGFLLVAGMVFIGVRQGVGQAAIGALFFVGLFLGYSLGWIPLWVILVIFTASLAAIFVLPRQSKDGV